MPCVVTFLSDFGVKDAYAAQVKAVILSLAPDALIVDITHEVEPYDIISAGWLLHASYRYFPEGTVHLAVVDPGVGTARAALLVKKDGHTFIGPDNGIFSFLFPADGVYEVLWRPAGAVSNTFHGRDVFAPVAARVLAGDEPDMAPAAAPVRIDTTSPMVVHIDRFGNVITNIPGAPPGQKLALMVAGVKVEGVYGTYGDIPAGRLGLVTGSAGTIEIAAYTSSASALLSVRPGDRIAVVSP